LTDKIVPDTTIAIGELGLSGECRAVGNLEQRVKEAARLGFTRAIVPLRNMEMRNLQIDGIEIVPIRGIFEALKELKAAEHIPGEF
jgi:DNA repair protein RadA/Sms